MSEFDNIFSNGTKYSFNTSDIQDIINDHKNFGLTKYVYEPSIKYVEEHYTLDKVINNINDVLDTDHVLHFKGMDNMKEIYEMIDNRNKGTKTTTRWRELKNILFEYGKYNKNNDYDNLYHKYISVYKKTILRKLDKLIHIDMEEADKLITESYHRRIIAFLDYMQELHSGKITVHKITEKFFGGHSNKDIFKNIIPPRSENYIVIPKDGIRVARPSFGSLVINVTNENDTSVLKDIPKIAISSIINPFKKNTKVAIYN
jgi:hypothetical protein